MEQPDYNVLFRWFVGFEMDEPIWVRSTASNELRSSRTGSGCGTADGVEQVGTGLGLTEECGATCGFSSGARFGIVVSGDADERSLAAFGHESLSEFDARHPAKMDVEHQAIEPRLFRVCEKRLG
jgi:hypothetical protein